MRKLIFIILSVLTFTLCFNCSGNSTNVNEIVTDTITNYSKVSVWNDSVKIRVIGNPEHIDCCGYNIFKCYKIYIPDNAPKDSAFSLYKKIINEIQYQDLIITHKGDTIINIKFTEYE